MAIRGEDTHMALLVSENHAWWGDETTCIVCGEDADAWAQFEDGAWLCRSCEEEMEQDDEA